MDPDRRRLVSNRPDTVKVSVADSGPDIPEEQTEVLSAGRETQLERASGLGLVRRTASTSGRDLWFGENEYPWRLLWVSLPALVAGLIDLRKLHDDGSQGLLRS